MIIYCFDLLSKSIKEYNTKKRRFYYDLRKLGLQKTFFRTKSVLCVENEKEVVLDLFFAKYKEDIALFKGKMTVLEKVYPPTDALALEKK